jgi:hypothetical protein
MVRILTDRGDKEMENQRKADVALKFRGIPVNQWKSGDCPWEECRNLVRVLARKSEILYRECGSDQDKVTLLRGMGSTLATLTALVNRLDQESENCHSQDVLKDARGFTYERVRFCDLDRICDK